MERFFYIKQNKTKYLEVLSRFNKIKQQVEKIKLLFLNGNKGRTFKAKTT